MKLVRIPGSVGNGLVGLSLPKSSGYMCSLHCQGNLFKGQVDPAYQGPEGTLALLLLPTTHHKLDNSH